MLSYIEARQRRIQAKVDEVKRELAEIQGITDEDSRPKPSAIRCRCTMKSGGC